ncbi:MAG TPA: DUF4153 domain-containing protein [Syntrophomonadaceae bacterium]|nr:DUF4153 domain-containing protein [Syntrophomonadaceae bacterium]
MKRFTEALMRLVRGLSEAVSRFPLTVICLVCAAVLICYMISLHKEPDLILQKLMFTFLLGSFLGVAAQFCFETFKRVQNLRLVIYIIAALLTAGYYLILAPAPDISFEVKIRTIVAVFAMFCIFIWVPSYRNNFDFNKIALIHFKSAFTAALYSGVLSAGCAAIITAIDILLIKLSSDVYGYTMTIIWVLFATIYYLSLLPRFSSAEETDRELAEQAAQYPKFLEILISYIAIPLVGAYTMVLAAYFIKILVTLRWPSGQLGVMVLAYSAAGLMILILASRLDNRFAYWYRSIFPKALIPVVVMQIVSVVIRLNAYGVTESRYYVMLFGLFSIVCGIFLSFRPVSRNGLIAILAAAIAVFSVIPPVDAFTVSRSSQITRLENMLEAEGILSHGKISPRENVRTTVKTESTSILSYLENRGYIKSVKWLPKGFKTFDDMKKTLGFEPSFAAAKSTNYYASLDMQKPVNISGYDILINTFLNSNMDKGSQPSSDFKINGIEYRLTLRQISAEEWYVSIKDAEGTELVGTGLKGFIEKIAKMGNMPKESIPPERMIFDTEKNGYKLRILFQNVNVYDGIDSGRTVDCSLFVMFKGPINRNAVLFPLSEMDIELR